ncbi:TPA: acid phosphatase, partial [Corynebacterium striatum]|nr:acid phosphatase [Corynebacterium striatum]HAT6399655.1 acid phosphatase [Corynebacterium striatum]HAT6407909.1 acid phosphatase [Corynebacterium striatum]HAT6410575.1 acid phosphatase [Corynebacterium striatum]HAT6413195.1 acid phosphatase [Corynebacterium striatum]
MFDHVKTQQPIMDENLEKAIAINNAAADDPALIKRAQQDAAADTDGVMLAVSDALGEEFGAAFRDA